MPEIRAGLQMAVQMKTALFLLCVGVALAAEAPTVEIPGGVTITGTTAQSRGGRTINSFFAIPYAEPPTADKRFMAPVKKSWEDGAQFVASNPGPVCTQFVGSGEGSRLPTPQDIDMNLLAQATENEDCLTLDVHVPQIDGSKKLPVLFYIHGGSFVGGTSQTMRPHYFLDHDMIIVAPQYRLGPLGFLKLQRDEKIVGNAALFDQLEALKWVQENIEAFGGDPDKVTLAGNSAGAVCAGLLYISPLTNNTLFQQVLQISGSFTAPFAIDLNAGVKGLQFANNVPVCNETATLEDVVPCLQDAEINVLKSAFMASVTNDLLGGGNGMANSLPSIQEAGEEIIIDGTVESMLPKKMGSLLPLVTGVTRHEGMYPVQIVEIYLNVINQVSGSQCFVCNQTGAILPLILGTSNSLLIEALQETYFPDEPYDSYTNMYPSFVDFIGAMYFKAPAYDMASRLGQNSEVYLYSFDHQDQFNYFGVGHAGDMVYLFPNGTNLTSEETEVSKKVVKLYANFVINGKPTADEGDAIPEWTPFNLKNPVYLEMNTQFELKTGFEDTYTVSRRVGLMKSNGAGPQVLPSLLTICLFNFLARLLK